MENNRSILICEQNIVVVSHIDILDMQPPLLSIISMEVNNLIIVVTCIMVYHQDPEIMLQTLQNIQCNNNLFKIDLFLQLLIKINTGRGMQKYIIPSCII